LGYPSPVDTKTEYRRLESRNAMRAYVEAYGCTLNVGESRELDHGKWFKTRIERATPTYLIGELEGAR
jgi:hypothetical protein